MAVLRLQRPFGKILVLAFPGLGFVGTIAGRYIVEKLNLGWVGYVYDESLPPVGKVKDGRLLYPINVFSDDGLSIVLAETAVTPDVVWNIARMLVTRAKKDGVNLIVPISGVLVQNPGEVYAIPSGSSARKVLTQLGIEEIENGVITGISAATLLLSREMGVPALLLLGSATSQQDFRAAVAVVEALSRLLNRDIPTEELLDLAHEYEHELKVIQKRMEESTSAPIYG